MMKTVVFYGPSIAAAEVRDLCPAAAHAPPIKRGDLATVGPFESVVILDGQFGDCLSVSPKEILAVLEQGKIVIGASSMGALRASEIDHCGMVGIGWVYEHFRRSKVRRDDEVALTYSPVDFQSLTIPMVDVLYWTDTLSSAGVLERSEAARIVRTARRLFFADRTEQRLMHALRRSLGIRRLDALLRASQGTIPNIKAIDARAALRHASSLSAQGRQPTANG